MCSKVVQSMNLSGFNILCLVWFGNNIYSWVTLRYMLVMGDIQPLAASSVVAVWDGSGGMAVTVGVQAAAAVVVVRATVVVIVAVAAAVVVIAMPLLVVEVI